MSGRYWPAGAGMEGADCRDGVGRLTPEEEILAAGMYGAL